MLFYKFTFNTFIRSIGVGTGKWMIKAMVDSKNKGELYYIKPEQQRMLNARIKAVLVPRDMNRKPRSLDNIKQWKGALSFSHFSCRQVNNM